MTELIPLSGKLLLSSIDWSAGTNRADRSRKQIEADDDLKAVMGWLARATGSPATFSNYRKEVMRLLLWCAREAGKPLSSLMYEDLLRYREFLRNPPDEYISKHTKSINHPEWRPFRKPLEDPSVRNAFSVLHALFEYLNDAKYLNGNPVRLLTKSGWSVPRVRRKPMPRDILDAIFEYAETMGEGPERVRARWLFSLFYRTGLRISEVSSGRMGDFFSEEVLDKETGEISAMWFLHVVGKGRKERDVVIPPALVEDLRAYRAMNGLRELPTPGEDTPLVIRLTGGKVALQRGGIHAFIKKILNEADAWLERQGSPIAGQLGLAHAHLFRHTGATHWLEDGANIADVRDNLGHHDLSTTSIYVNPDKSSRFEAIRNAQERRSKS